MRIAAPVIDWVEAEMDKSAGRRVPVDPLRRAALVAEEAGEALKAAVDLTRTSIPSHEIVSVRGELRDELVQTVAMALRVLMAMSDEDRGNE